MNHFVYFMREPCKCDTQRKVVVGQKEKNCEQALKVLEFTCTKKPTRRLLT